MPLAQVELFGGLNLSAIEPSLDLIHVKRVESQVNMLSNTLRPNIEDPTVELYTAGIVHPAGFFPEKCFPQLLRGSKAEYTRVFGKNDGRR